MTLPSSEEVFRIDSPDGFLALLVHGDLDEATASWWTAVIAACSSCLTLAGGVGNSDAIDWARTLVFVLDGAARTRLLRPMEIISRRVNVQVPALMAGHHDFGDATMICRAVLDELAHLGEDVRVVASEVNGISIGNVLPNSRIADLHSLRRVFRNLVALRILMPEGEVRSSFDSWIEALRVDGSEPGSDP